MTQGQTTPNNQSKQSFINEIVKTFYENPHLKTSKELLDFLKNKYANDPVALSYINQLTATNKEDKYGTLTLLLKSSPSDVQIKLKRPDAYGGPKTENYLDRIDLRIQAAFKYIDEEEGLPEKRAKLKQQVLQLGNYIKNKMMQDCYLSPDILKGLQDNQSQALQHFQQQHEKAEGYLSTFNDLLVKNINPRAKSKKVKKELYLIETKLMSDKKRPQRINARPIVMDGKTYYEVSHVQPVTPERTVSSSKKDEAGVANWLKSTTTILSDTFDMLDERELFRSASIIPHDIIKGGNLSRELAIDTTRRNVLEHIIPSLAQEILTKNPLQTDPIVINYEMLTLLSPIHALADKAFDPDLAQFNAIRNALERYQGRTFNIEVNGNMRQVKFNSIYQNFGVNPGRKISTAAYFSNQKAYNDTLERSIANIDKHLQNVSISSQFNESKSTLMEILENPKFSKDVLDELDFLETALSGNDGLYEKMEKNSARFTTKDHERLLALNAKKMDKRSLSNEDMKEFKRLKSKFNHVKSENAELQNLVDDYQNRLYQIHAYQAMLRQDNILNNAVTFEKILPLIEASNNEDEKKVAAHIRALYEYTKLIVAGTDALTGDQDIKNARNYEIQCYIERINSFCGWSFHETCKSGKDRTNAAVEKQKAKAMISLHTGRLVQGESEKPALKLQERKLFVQGYQQGPGNDICGDNMKPGAQQVDKGDFSSDAKAAISAGKQMASLQKGLNDLKAVPTSVRTQIMADYSRMPTPVPKKQHEVTIASHRIRPITNQANTNNAKENEFNTTLASIPSTVLGLNKRINPNDGYKTELMGFKELKITPDATHSKSFYAKYANNKVDYCVKGIPNDQELIEICKFAVKYAKKHDIFDLSRASPDIQNKMHSMLEQEIKNAGMSQFLSISLNEPPKASSQPTLPA